MASTPAHPSLVIFPGAWHPAMCMAALVDSLQRMGFAAEAHTLRSVGNPAAGVADDAAHMLAVMRPLLDAGKDVVLVAHSYAGFPATSAISGLDKRSRRAKNGSQTAGGGVLGIIFLAAFVPVQGDSIYGLIGETWLPWQTPQRNQVLGLTRAGRGGKQEPKGLITVLDPRSVFYGDCSEDSAAPVVTRLKGHSIKAFRGDDAIPHRIGWAEEGFNGHRAYVRCTMDKALEFPTQELFTARTGLDWILKTMEASHSPFMSMPDATARVVEDVISEFQAADAAATAP